MKSSRPLPVFGARGVSRRPTELSRQLNGVLCGQCLPAKRPRPLRTVGGPFDDQPALPLARVNRIGELVAHDAQLDTMPIATDQPHQPSIPRRVDQHDNGGMSSPELITEQYEANVESLQG